MCWDEDVALISFACKMMIFFFIIARIAGVRLRGIETTPLASFTLKGLIGRPPRKEEQRDASPVMTDHDTSLVKHAHAFLSRSRSVYNCIKP